MHAQSPRTRRRDRRRRPDRLLAAVPHRGGRDAGEGPADDPADARDPGREGAEGAEGRDDGARRLRLSPAPGHGRRLRAGGRVPRCRHRAAGRRAPRGPGMERKDLLEANGRIFAPQGRALDKVAKRDVKVLVVGNPANTNCLIAMKNAPGLKPAQFTGMMRLDHNRALTQVAQKTGKAVTEVKKMSI